MAKINLNQIPKPKLYASSSDHLKIKPLILFCQPPQQRPKEQTLDLGWANPSSSHILPTHRYSHPTRTLAKLKMQACFTFVEVVTELI